MYKTINERIKITVIKLMLSVIMMKGLMHMNIACDLEMVTYCISVKLGNND